MDPKALVWIETNKGEGGLESQNNMYVRDESKNKPR